MPRTIVAGRPRTERDWDRCIDTIARLPYRQPPFSRRNWGHPMHSLCSYPSKLKPGLAHHLVRGFTRPGEVVLDPFSGVGTIPFEACSQGRIGIGGDLSPFAAVVTAAKVAPPDLDDLGALLDELEAFVCARKPLERLETVSQEIRAFFHDETCREVLAAQRFFYEAGGIDTASGKLACSATCHILHGNRPYALSRRSHGIIPIPPKGEFIHKPLMRSLRAKLARVSLDTLPPRFRPGLGKLMDAGHLDLPDSSVGALITSPPFLGTTQFLRQNRVRLWFCGMDLEEQQAHKHTFAEYRRDLTFYSELLAGMGPGHDSRSTARYARRRREEPRYG